MADIDQIIIIMKKTVKISVSLLVVAFMVLFACQKKQVSPLSGNASEESADVLRSTGGTTGTTGTGTLSTTRIMGSSSDDYFSSGMNTRNVFMLNSMTYANMIPYAVASGSERYFCVGSYAADICTIKKTDGLAPITLLYDGVGGSRSGDLKLGSPSGADFMPNEIEMTTASMSSVYAFSGNTVYRIDGIAASSPYATAIFTIPTSTAQIYHSKTICQGDNSNELKIIIAATAMPRGSTVSQMQMYTLSNLSGSPSLSLNATLTGITYSNSTNLSSYNLAGDYRIVIGNSTAHTGNIYTIDLTTNTINSSSVGSFVTAVNDCSIATF